MPTDVEVVVDDIVKISKGDLRTAEFTAKEPAILLVHVTVKDGPKVDLYTTDGREFSEYMAGKRFNVFDKLSSNKTKQFTAEVRVQSGEIVVFVENNGSGGILSSLTDSTATVEMKVALKPRPN